MEIVSFSVGESFSVGKEGLFGLGTRFRFSRWTLNNPEEWKKSPSSESRHRRVVSGRRVRMFGSKQPYFAQLHGAYDGRLSGTTLGLVAGTKISSRLIEAFFPLLRLGRSRGPGSF